MLFNHVLGIYCHFCRLYKDPHTEVYLPDEEEGRVNCLQCNNVLGYTWDLTWIEYWKSN